MKFLLINYDNGSRFPVLPQNLMVLEAALEKDRHEVEILDFNLRRGVDGYNRLLGGTFDVIGLGFIAGYWPHKEAYEIAQVIGSDRRRSKFKFIIGGHGPSAAPEYYLDFLGADTCFVGSADYTVRAWVENGMPGGVIRGDNSFDMELQIMPPDVGMDVYKRIRFPLTKANEFAIQLLSARGCPYSCAFCYRMDRAYSCYSPERIASDIEWYYLTHNVTHFQFSDELLMGSRRFIFSLCDELIDLSDKHNQCFKFDCNGRLNMADVDVLEAMRDAGFVYINYGCEAMDDGVLKAINKKQTVADIERGIKNTIKAKISPGINFMWGNPGDSKESLMGAVNFLLENDPCDELRTIRPVTPYPGTELFNRLGITVDEFYARHVNSDLFSFHFMDGLSNEAANELLYDCNRMLMNNYYQHSLVNIVKGAKDFYLGKTDPLRFRGFREI